MSGDVLWVRSRGSNTRGDGDGMSRFSGGLMAAAIDCQALDFDYCCPVACMSLCNHGSRAGRAYYQRCRAHQRPKWVVSASFGGSRGPPSSRGHSWSLLRGSPVEEPPCPRGGEKKRSSVRGQKGTWTIITRCFDIDMTAVSLAGPPFETWFGGRNPSYALRAHRCWSASRLRLAQVPTGDPGAAKRGSQPSRPVRLGNTTGHLLDRCSRDRSSIYSFKSENLLFLPHTSFVPHHALYQIRDRQRGFCMLMD